MTQAPIVTTATVQARQKTYEVRAGMTVRDTLLRLQLNPESYLATRQGMMLTDDEIVHPGDVIRLVAVISGG